MAKQGGLGDDQLDVAVFRFTLGIPGFEDRFIPQVVGGVAGALLAFNHLITAQPIAVAQGRAELLCGALVLLLLLVPEIEERLREAQPGRGRLGTTGTVAGASNAFLLDAKLTDKQKQELAWCSFALLKNTNCCGVLVHSASHTLLGRGALSQGAVTQGQTDTSLNALTQDMSSVLSVSPELREVLTGVNSQVWLPDRSAVNRIKGLAGTRLIPEGVESLLVQSIPPVTPDQGGGQGGVIMVYSERPRALSDRERRWVAEIARKLSAALA